MAQETLGAISVTLTGRTVGWLPSFFTAPGRPSLVHYH